jgi:hypothetical protein
MKPTYTKLAADGSALPDDHPNDGPGEAPGRARRAPDACEADHRRPRIGALLGARPSRRRGELAAQHTAYGWTWRAGGLEEFFFVSDRTRTQVGLDVEFFPDADGYEGTWTSDVDASSPSDCAWGVYLGDGDADWYFQSATATSARCAPVSSSTLVSPTQGPQIMKSRSKEGEEEIRSAQAGREAEGLAHALRCSHPGDAGLREGVGRWQGTPGVGDDVGRRVRPAHQSHLGHASPRRRAQLRRCAEGRGPGEALRRAGARTDASRSGLTINDYARHSPALDTEFFAKQSGWEWTSTQYASSPSGCAWYVDLGNGTPAAAARAYHVQRPRGARRSA